MLCGAQNISFNRLCAVARIKWFSVQFESAEFLKPDQFWGNSKEIVIRLSTRMIKLIMSCAFVCFCVLWSLNVVAFVLRKKKSLISFFSTLNWLLSYLYANWLMCLGSRSKNAYWRKKSNLHRVWFLLNRKLSISNNHLAVVEWTFLRILYSLSLSVQRVDQCLCNIITIDIIRQWIRYWMKRKTNVRNDINTMKWIPYGVI